MHSSLFSSRDNIWVGASKPLGLDVEDNFIFYQTSGSTADSKWIAYKKNKFLKAAESANQFLNMTAKDTWLDVLPSHHVASLSVGARAYSAGFQIISSKEKWNPEVFIKKIKKATVSSLVPTQVYDLVEKNLKAPQHIRFVLVGGGAISSSLYKKARDLGWPILPTYGLSEAGSQVATASLESLASYAYPALNFLSHVRPSINNEGFLKIKSDFLFEGYYCPLKKSIKKREHDFLTSDKAIIESNQLISVRRDSSSKKILGVLVDKEQIKSELLKNYPQWAQKIELAFVKDGRTENRLIVISESSVFSEVSARIEAYNLNAEGPNRVSKIYQLSEIPRSALGKPQIPKIIEALGLI